MKFAFNKKYRYRSVLFSHKGNNMLKRIGWGLLGLGMLVDAQTYAMVHQMKSAVSMDLELAPNEAQNYSNVFLWSISAQCTIHTPDESDVLHVKVVKGSGELNGQKLDKDQSLDIVVHNGDKLNIKAYKRSSVDLTNLGQHTVSGTCTTD